MQPPSDGCKRTVHSPERHTRNHRSRQQVCIDPTYSSATEPAVRDEFHYLIVRRQAHMGQARKAPKNLLALSQIATGKFTNDERVTSHPRRFQQFVQPVVPPS